MGSPWRSLQSGQVQNRGQPKTAKTRSTKTRAPAGPRIYYATMNPRVLEYEVMQDDYHQQLNKGLFLLKLLKRTSVNEMHEPRTPGGNPRLDKLLKLLLVIEVLYHLICINHPEVDRIWGIHIMVLS